MKLTAKDFEKVDLDELLDDDGACGDPECCPGGPSYNVSMHKLLLVVNEIIQRKENEGN